MLVSLSPSSSQTVFYSWKGLGTPKLDPLISQMLKQRVSSQQSHPAGVQQSASPSSQDWPSVPLQPWRSIALGGFKVALDTHGEKSEGAGLSRVEEWPSSPGSSQNTLPGVLLKVILLYSRKLKIAPGNICFVFSISRL